MTNPSEEPESISQALAKRKSMLFVPLQAGCLTFVIAGIAIVVGFLIDSRLGTVPRWTLILLAASVPFSLGMIYVIIRRALRKGRAEVDTPEVEGES